MLSTVTVIHFNLDNFKYRTHMVYCSLLKSWYYPNQNKLKISFELQILKILYKIKFDILISTTTLLCIKILHNVQVRNKIIPQNFLCSKNLNVIFCSL